MRHSMSTMFVIVLFALSCLAIPLIPASAQDDSDADNVIQTAIEKLASDTTADRNLGKGVLNDAGRDAIQPVLEAIEDSNDLSTKVLLRSVMSNWADSWKGEDAVQLLEALNGEQAKAITELDDLRYSENLDKAAQKWICGDSKTRFRHDMVFFSEWEYSQRKAKLLGMLPDIQTISISADMPQEFFACLKNSDLGELLLQGQSYSMERDVELPQSVMDGPTMQAILQIGSLTTLKMQNVQLSEDAAKSLGASKNIVDLAYQYSDASVLRQVCNMEQLQTLRFIGKVHGERIPVSAGDLGPLTNLKDLDKLELGFLEIDPAFSETLKGLPDLESLNLMFPSDELLEAVIQYEELHDLIVLPVLCKSDQTATLLSKASHLKSVSIQSMSLTDVGLNALVDMDSLERLSVMGGFFSKGVANRAKEKFKRSGFHLFFDDYVSEKDSLAIHEFAQKGLVPHSFPRQSQFYVFKEHWTGSDEEFLKLVESRFWQSLQTDIPLSDELAAALMKQIDRGKIVVVYDSGQHAMGVVDEVKESCKSMAIPKWQQMAYPVQGTGDCWLFK